MRIGHPAASSRTPGARGRLHDSLHELASIRRYADAVVWLTAKGDGFSNAGGARSALDGSRARGRSRARRLRPSARETAVVVRSSSLARVNSWSRLCASVLVRVAPRPDERCGGRRADTSDGSRTGAALATVTPPGKAGS